MYANFITAVSTALLAVTTVFLALYTYKLWASNQNFITLSNRPFFIIKNLNIFTNSKSFDVSFDLVNSGNSLAHKVHIACILSSSEEENYKVQTIHGNLNINCKEEQNCQIKFYFNNTPGDVINLKIHFLISYQDNYKIQYQEYIAYEHQNNIYRKISHRNSFPIRLLLEPF